jgi:hypothetical protein
MKNVVGNREALDLARTPSQSLINYVAQELLQSWGVGERSAGEDARKLCRYDFRT